MAIFLLIYSHLNIQSPRLDHWLVIKYYKIRRLAPCSSAHTHTCLAVNVISYPLANRYARYLPACVLLFLQLMVQTVGQPFYNELYKHRHLKVEDHKANNLNIVSQQLDEVHEVRDLFLAP